MEEKIKSIIAGFIKVPVESITAETRIDRSAVSNSIMLHRMFAKLAEEGVHVENYMEIKNVGALLQQASHDSSMIPAPVASANGVHKNGAGAGVDIEEIANLPQTSDFREHEFYTMNFTPPEIAYCILQPDPYASFAGLFAAKEAIVKANGAYRNKPFNTIEISHEEDGKPVFGNYLVSISHGGNLAVAVVVSPAKVSEQQSYSREILPSPAPPAKSASRWLWLLCFLIALAALIIALKKV